MKLEVNEIINDPAIIIWNDGTITHLNNGSACTGQMIKGQLHCSKCGTKYERTNQ